MKNYTKEAPLAQQVLQLDTLKKPDTTIPVNIVEKGVLVTPSGMPTFIQEGMPELETIDKSDKLKSNCEYKRFYIHTYHGKLKDYHDGIPCYCPICYHQVSDNGTLPCTLAHLPLGDRYTRVEVQRRRVRCSNPQCGYNYTYPVDFKADGHMITQPLLNYTQHLLSYESLTLKAVAHLTGLNKNTVKAIHKAMLEDKYTVDGKGKELIKPEKYSRYLGIDEFKLHDGYHYATIVIDLETGFILHLAQGKKKMSVYDFIDRVGEEWMSHVEAVACDMNSDFAEAFLERCSHIEIVYDFFHIVKNFNDKVVSAVRKDEQKRLISEGRLEDAAKLKHGKYVLMENPETREQKDRDAAEGKLVSKKSELFNKPEVKHKGGHTDKYNQLISENQLFLVLDIVKEALQEAYKEKSVSRMSSKIKNIIDICKDTENEHFLWFARLLENHFDGIVNHAKFPISTGKVEGINNLVKTERRTGYGYPDDEYFFLRLMDASRRKSRFLS